MNKQNIILIGMPGSGKSTCGVLTAKVMLKNFFDTDLLLQGMQEKKLQDSKALELKRFLQNTFPNVKKLLQIQGNLGVNALQICAKLI